jgi:DNA-binding CsgD family transcriptional regulator
VDADRLGRTRDKVERLADSGLGWVDYATQLGETIRQAIPFDRSCWHTVDPGTVLFTGSLNKDIECSGLWLAQHEYVVDDVNKWWFLARSGRCAGATSIATHGDLSRSVRHRSHETYGIGDELRGSFVADGTYWAAAAFLRDADQPWFTEADVRFLATLSEPIARGFRRRLVGSPLSTDVIPSREGPGVIVLDEDGNGVSTSPAAEHWVSQMVEEPPPRAPLESKMVQIVAARARTLADDGDPLELAARSRVRTRSGGWLLLYGTRLSGKADGQVAVIIQPASPSDVAPLVALAYGLTGREREVTRLCILGQSTKQIAGTLRVSPYTVQDHLKSIFDKTGVGTRGELVGQVFLEHYIPRWDDLSDTPSGWLAKAAPTITRGPDRPA